MRFLIIGGDAAGMSAASRAKRNDPDMEIVVLEKSSDVSYSACGMPYNLASGDRSMDDLVVRPAHVFREKHGIDVLNGHTVTSIDPDTRTVSGITSGGEGFSLPYDKLLIATGAVPIRPSIPGADAPGVLVLKSLADGRYMKQYIAKKGVKKALILGMGYIGLEIADALRFRDIEVSMLKPRATFLPWMAPELSEVVRKEMLENGVDLHAGRVLKSIEPKTEGLTAICEDGEINADMIVSAMGVTPNSSIAETAGIALGSNGEIVVNRLQETSVEDIYAAGDCADAYHVVTGRKTWIPLALLANRGGRVVGDNVCGRKLEAAPIAGTSVFKVFTLEVARTGLSEAEARNAGFDPVKVFIKSRSRAHAHPGSNEIYLQMIGDKKSGRLIGTQMVGREGVAHRINAPATALASGMTVEEFSQTDMAYAPPFGPVWDPLLIGASQLLKKM